MDGIRQSLRTLSAGRYGQPRFAAVAATGVVLNGALVVYFR